MHLSVAAGVAGTMAVTGTVVATMTHHPTSPRFKPIAYTPADRTDISSTQGKRDVHDAVLSRERAHQKRLAELRAKRRAEARRKAAAAKKRAEARQAAAEAARKRRQAAASSYSSSMSASAAHVLEIAAAQEGDTYVHGAAGPDQFDCSGFTQYVFGQVGIALPHSAAGQASMATPVSDPRPGDLVIVYNGSGGSVGHVAIYAGSGYWYEAANPDETVGKHRAWSTNVSYGRVL
jgi:cell wall-associated NlpC family hydrolase